MGRAKGYAKGHGEQGGGLHEQWHCCILKMVSVHPAPWSKQRSGRSQHHSSKRRKTIHAKINKGVKKIVFSGAPMEAPTAGATTVGSAVSVYVVPVKITRKRKGFVSSLGHMPHLGWATHHHAHPHARPHQKIVCSKISCLGCSNLGPTGLLNLHYVVLLHLLSRRCGFLPGLLSHLRMPLHHPSAPRLRQPPGFVSRAAPLPVSRLPSAPVAVVDPLAGAPLTPPPAPF